MTIDEWDGRRLALSGREHAHCFVCGEADGRGVHLEITSCKDGVVEAVFPCDPVFQGYDGVLHGGVISCLLDGAMTNCLFSRGITATTGELVLRYLHPVITGLPATVKARVRKSHRPLHIVEAELSQEGRLLVRATAKFMERSTASQ